MATAHGLCRPDRRWFVSVDGWREEDHAPLVHAMLTDLPHDLYTRIDGQDQQALEQWSRYGFRPHRRELEFLIPPDPERTGLQGTLVPEGVALLPAEDVDETELRKLDDRLRNDIAGTTGWVNDPAEFSDYVFDDQRYDAACNLVAIDDRRRQLAGLVRIWLSSTRARLNLVAVTRAYRRRGLARAMLAAALAPVAERGILEVMAEVDDSNVAGQALLRGIGAVETGSSLVLEREL